MTGKEWTSPDCFMPVKRLRCPVPIMKNWWILLNPAADPLSSISLFFQSLPDQSSLRWKTCTLWWIFFGIRKSSKWYGFCLKVGSFFGYPSFCTWDPHLSSQLTVCSCWWVQSQDPQRMFIRIQCPPWFEVFYRWGWANRKCLTCKFAWRRGWLTIHFTFLKTGGCWWCGLRKGK